MVVWVVGLTLLLDQASKLLARQSLTLGEPVPLALPVVQLTLVHNTGAAFGLFQRGTVVFIIVSVVTCALIIWTLWRPPEKDATTGATRMGHDRWLSAALALVLGGAIGNLIDRMAWGYVIDFIDLRVWPVFNIADSAITVGVSMLLWRMVRPRCSTSGVGCHHGR